MGVARHRPSPEKISSHKDSGLSPHTPGDGPLSFAPRDDGAAGRRGCSDRGGEPLDGGEKRGIPNRRLVLRFWGREDGGGSPQTLAELSLFQSADQFPSWSGTDKGLVRPKALRKAGGLCSRQWEERLAGRALWRQCLWERGGFSRPWGTARRPAAVALPVGQWGAIEDVEGGAGSTLLPAKGQKAGREGRRSPAAVEVGPAFAQSRVTPLHWRAASVAVGDRPLRGGLPTRWKGAVPAVVGKSPSIFLPVGWGRLSLLILGGRKYGAVPVVCRAAGRTPLNMGALSFGCWAGRRTYREERGKLFSGRAILSRVALCEGEMGMPSLPYG